MRTKRRRSVKVGTSLVRRKGRVLRSKRRKTIKLSLARTPFPQTKIVRHRYVESVYMPAVAASAGTSSYVFSMNDMFDPNFSGTGHQPLFRDELAARYKNYTVLASYITVVFGQIESTPTRSGIMCSDDSAPFQVVYGSRIALEQFGYNSSLCVNSRAEIMAQRNSPLTLRNSYNAKKWYKTNLAGIMSDADKKTAAGSSPAERLYYFIFRESIDNSLALSDLPIDVEITYITAWRDPADPVAS